MASGAAGAVAAWIAAAAATVSAGTAIYQAATTETPDTPETPAAAVTPKKEDTGAIVALGADQAAERTTKPRKRTGLSNLGAVRSGISI